MAEFIDIEYIFMVRKDGIGGVLKYRKDRFDTNKNVRSGYRLAKKEEIEKYYHVDPVIEQPIEVAATTKDQKDKKAQETTSQDKKQAKAGTPNDEVIKEEVSDSDNN